MADVPAEIIQRLRTICSALPEAYEEPAWVGLRWRIRLRTFAHVLTITDGKPAPYARFVGPGPVTIVTFRSPTDEIQALANAGPPFFVARWGSDLAGLQLDGHSDWREVAELLLESYCVLAPQKLVRQVDRPPG